MTIARIHTVSHAEILALVNYEPETGVFTRRVTIPGHKAGAVLGSIDKDGYRRIKLKGHRYQANRLAWFYMTGTWPSTTVDHRDLVRNNDAWDNLREATFAQQSANRSAQGHRVLKGTTLHRTGRWQAQITVHGQSHYLGLFDTELEAHAAYVSAANQSFGEFARAS